MITEFIGPPGSGKSTVARDLAAQHGGEVVKLNGYADGFSVGRLRPVLSQPALFLAAVLIDRRYAVNLARRNQLIRRVRDESVWVEDGPLFALCRMLATAERTDPAKVVRVLDNLRLPDRCIAVDAAPETCLYRLRRLRAGNNRIARMADTQALERLRNLKNAVDNVIKCLPRHVEVVRLDNDQHE
jgi:hypothetical protein